MKHSHPDPEEIALFADSILKGTPPLAKLGPIQRQGRHVCAKVSTKLPIIAAHLNYTLDSGQWPKRNWQTVPARWNTKEQMVEAELPDPLPTVFYLDVVDSRNAMTSTPPEILRATVPSP